MQLWTVQNHQWIVRGPFMDAVVNLGEKIIYPGWKFNMLMSMLMFQWIVQGQFEDR